MKRLKGGRHEPPPSRNNMLQRAETRKPQRAQLSGKQHPKGAQNRREVMEKWWS